MECSCVCKHVDFGRLPEVFQFHGSPPSTVFAEPPFF